MKRQWKKGAIALVAFVLVAFMASSAMAIILNARSEEMTANSTCDLAGTVDLKFGQIDYDRALNHWLVEGFVQIRSTLGGENIELTADVPRLCKDIVGDDSADDYLGVALPNSGKLVALDVIGVEVSDLNEDNIPDVEAYAYGKSGNQYFTIYVVDIQADAIGEPENQWPWVKVGLYEAVDVSTAICADVNDFGPLAILDVSLDIEPTDMTYTTSDNQIGHFLPMDVEFRPCDPKDDEQCPGSDATTIELCEIGEQDTCDTYYKCIVAEGTYPSSGVMNIKVRSNGATNGANTQEGVYIRNVTLYNDAGGLITPYNLGAEGAIESGWRFYQANGTTLVDGDDLNCGFLAEQVSGLVNAGDLSGDLIQFCIAYQVNADEVTRDANGEILNPTVQFWIEMASVPCGNILSEAINAATLVECGGEPSCMYFPYVLHGYTMADPGVAWFSGLAVTNLGGVPVEEMEVSATLTDSTGTSFTGTIPDTIANGAVFAFSLDQLIAAMGWEVADGPAWLAVQGNFTIDGYSFNFEADSGYGAGTEPRLLERCGDFTDLK